MAKRKGPGRKSGGSTRRVRTAKATRRAARKSARAASRPRPRAKAKPKAKTTRKRAAPRAKTARTAKRASAKRSTGRAAKAKAPARRATSAAQRPAKTAARPVAKTPAPQPRAARPAAAKSQPKAPAAPRTPARAARPSTRRVPLLDRERRTVREDEPSGPPSSLDMPRPASSVRTGRAELAEKLHHHTSTGPALTAGDIDADWASAESVGDEAPGGDNPTPDQDVVEEIGKALGVQYDDDEELQGGDEIVERDRNRWELDPASSDDFDDREDRDDRDD